MPTNLLQIRRSTANATVTGLQPGELAFTQAGNTLHIGLPDGSGVLRIGGTQVPGVLTNNHALVANSTGGIDKVITANLVANSIWANGAAGTAGDVLTSNGTAIYWKAPSAGVAGSDTQVQFNDGGTLAGDAGLTFNKTTDTLSTNTVLATSTVNAATLSVGTSVVANSTRLALGTAVGLQVNGTIGTAGQILYSNGTTGYWAAPPTGDITAVTAGSGLTGGGTSGDVTLDVGAGNGVAVDADSIRVVAGASGGLISNSTGVFITAGDGLLTNATGLHVGTGNGVSIDATSIRVVAATGGGLQSTAVGVAVIPGDGLISNTTGLHVVPGNGISSSADALAVNGGSTLTVNTAGVHVNTTLSITSLTTSGDLSVNGNARLGDATSDVASINARVNTAIVPSANVTYDLGENLLRWKNVFSSHVQTVSADVTGNLTVGGDLTVTGNLTTIGVSSLEVTDPMIKLAVNNTTGDTLYIGFAGHYNGSGNTTNHTGLVREPTNKNYYLFSTYGDEASVDSNQIVVTDPSFALANLNAYLLSGGLVTNATHVAITANSTVNVAIAANTLTLSTALAGTSGGTGRSTSTNNALLVGNSTNGYNELTLGTSGFVLQSNGTALVYDSIDGGTF